MPQSGGISAFSYLPPGTTPTHTKKKFDGSESNEPSHADHGTLPGQKNLCGCSCQAAVKLNDSLYLMRVQLRCRKVPEY